MTEILEANVHRAMRSLFRFSQYTENYPEILIENERKILKESFDKLTADQIKYVVENWPEYHSQQTIQDKLDNDRLTSMLQREFPSSN